MDWQERKGSLFASQMGTVSSGHKLSTVPALNSKSSVASPGAVGKAVSSFRPPMSPGLVFHPEEGSYIICLHTRFPRKSSFEAGLPGLSSVSTSACQQAAMPVLPLMLILIRAKQNSHGAFQRHSWVKPCPVSSQTLFMFTVFSCLDHSLCLLQ